MTKSQSVLREWNALQELIKPFCQNKALIIEAVEFHLHQASSLTTENSHEPLLNYREWERQKESLTQDLATAINEQEKENIKKELLQLNQALANQEAVSASFNSQKVKNEKIVQACRELLAQLTK